MALVINNTPAAYSSAHGDLVYTAYESVKANDPTTYVNYKYVCDVYIAGTMVVRLKAFPNPDNKRGIFNIGIIVRNYVNANFNPSLTAVKAQELTAFFASVQCKFGEEYGGTLYTNVTTDSARNFYNHYNGRLVGGYTILSNYVDAFASNRPSAVNTLISGSQVFIPYFPSTTSAITLNVKSYDSGGSQLSNEDFTITPTAAYYLQQLNVAPAVLNTVTAGTVPANTAYYVITIDDQSYRVNVACEPRFTPYTLHFLNQLGGYESFVFTKVSKKSADITRKSYVQLPYKIDSNGIMSYYNGTTLVDNKITYYGDAQEKKIINSDYVDENTINWLAELVKSPQIYLEQGGYFIPVTISDPKYDYKTRAVDRLFNLTLNIEFADNQNVQYR